MISESILEGDKVRLRPMEEGDLPRFVDWLADAEVTQWLAELSTPPTLEEEHEWYERRRGDPDSLMWAIETADGRLVGSTELRLDPSRRKAEFGIVIGEKSEWSAGLGTDAVRLIVGYAFAELELNRVELTTSEENLRAIRCYEKVGFVKEGLKRQDRLIEGRFGNTLMMGILREEWAAAKAGVASRKKMKVNETTAPSLEGTLVRLRTLHQGDLPALIRWYGDPEVNHWLHQSEYRDVSEQRVRAKFGPGSETTSDLRWIIEAVDGTAIGVIRLEGIEGAHARAELAVSIGEKAYWSRGYGTEAIRLALRHGFLHLGLRRVWLVTDMDNERGIRCYEKCGFRREGLLRSHRVRYGEPLDMVVMGVLREEWQAASSR